MPDRFQVLRPELKVGGPHLFIAFVRIAPFLDLLALLQLGKPFPAARGGEARPGFPVRFRSEDAPQGSSSVSLCRAIRFLNQANTESARPPQSGCGPVPGGWVKRLRSQSAKPEK